MRIAFMGTPTFAVPTLDALLRAGHEIAAVYCQPPRVAGRGRAVRPSPVQLRGEAAGLEVRTPLSLRDTQTQTEFAALGLDAAIVAAYGLILPVQILEAPRRGCLNVHASLLPRWRGAAPIQRAILAGDEITGVTIMGMEQGLDTGPIYALRETPVDAKTAGELTTELARIGAELMVEVLGRLDSIVPRPQPDDGATYAAKIEKSEAKLDFSQSAEAVEQAVRAFNPAPGAWFEISGERIKLLEARISEISGSPGEVVDTRLTIACGTGAIAPTLLQRAGRGVMTSDEFLRGFPVPPGTRVA